jgi:hypothetical protein
VVPGVQNPDRTEASLSEVASKNVGFHVYKLRSSSCHQYQIFFSLWGMVVPTGFMNMGSSWLKRIISGLVQLRKSSQKKSYHDVVHRGYRLSGVNRCLLIIVFLILGKLFLLGVLSLIVLIGHIWINRRIIREISIHLFLIVWNGQLWIIRWIIREIIDSLKM